VKLFLVLVYFCAVFLFQDTSPCKQSGRLTETQVREMAIERPLPSYPEDAKKAGITGVVVVQFHLNESNKVDSVKILEAPSKSIAETSNSAVWKWKFSPIHSGDTEICMTGKLTFYFAIEEGKAYVRDPRRYQRMPH
jgi:TonB family protein